MVRIIAGMSGSFLSELKRRNVLRVAMAYAALVWLLVQIAETIMPLHSFSEDAIRTIVPVLLLDPALNPDEDTFWVWGLRFRLNL